MRKKQFILLAVVCLAVIIVVVAVFQINSKNIDKNQDRPTIIISDNQPPNKEDYKSLDLTRFREAYNTASDNQEDWITDPQEVALRFAGFPNLEGILPDEVIVFPTSTEQVTIIILQLQIPDDSVASVETRVDLVQNGRSWEVEWAGGRWRCKAGRGHQDWLPEFCY
jgi:hypothetical protein